MTILLVPVKENLGFVREFLQDCVKSRVTVVGAIVNRYGDQNHVCLTQVVFHCGLEISIAGHGCRRVFRAFDNANACFELVTARADEVIEVNLSRGANRSALLVNYEGQLVIFGTGVGWDYLGSNSCVMAN